MGSCLSKRAPPAREQNTSSTPDDDAAVDRNLPAELPAELHPPEEDAVVKEVLTETPNPSAAVAASVRVSVPGPPEMGEVPPATGNKGETSETSEMCSVSESFSVSTTFTDKKDAAVSGEEADTATSSRRGKRGPERRRLPEWSPPGKSCHRRRRFPSGELSAMPPRLRTKSSGDDDLPSSLARDASRARLQVAAAAQRRNHADRRDRRSASPAGKRLAELRAAGAGEGGLNRSSSVRRAERAPEPASEGPSKSGGEGEAEDRMGTAVEESLENPLVSLECFIFL